MLCLFVCLQCVSVSMECVTKVQRVTDSVCVNHLTLGRSVMTVKMLTCNVEYFVLGDKKWERNYDINTLF